MSAGPGAVNRLLPVLNTHHIIVGMSGGVDSAVAALLLKDKGHKVTGLFMKNWEEDDDEDYCAAAEDLEDAQSVCDHIGIDLLTVNFSSEYWDRVFKHFLAEYEAGRTPNPDILCNKEIKFRAFLDHAKSLGANHIATGHYARISNNDSYRLIKGKDNNKDQSYFLHTLGQDQLKHSLFPIGEINKSQVRSIARENGLSVHEKKDSTGICFIGERRFNIFLEKYLPGTPGEIKTTDGSVIGEHRGLMFYTLGQRKGLGIGGKKNAGESPWYTLDKDVPSNTLIVGQGENHPMLYHKTCTSSQLHWISDSRPTAPLTCTAKVRYRQPDQACTITQLDNDSCHVEFENKQRAITPGQSVVFYDGEVCLGGGVIMNYQ